MQRPALAHFSDRLPHPSAPAKLAFMQFLRHVNSISVSGPLHTRPIYRKHVSPWFCAPSLPSFSAEAAYQARPATKGQQ